MDKGLEKINIFKINLKILNEQLIEKDDIRMKKSSKKHELSNEEYRLECELKSLSDNKEKIEDKNKNIKKWRNKTIIKTILFTLLTETPLYLLFSIDHNIILYFLTSVCALIFSVLAGESNNYYSNKKFLKDNKLVDILIKINECKNKLKYNKKKQNMLDKEIKVLEDETNKIEDEIKNIKTKISEVENIRADIINNFLESNKEVEILLNSAYNFYEEQEQKNKQLIKE